MNEIELIKPVISGSLAYLENNSENNSENSNEIINIKNDNDKDKNKEKDYKEKDDINDSCALDIIAVYLKGQKNIYMESKLYCQQILNILMLPAIFISALASVLSLSFDNFEFNAILISSLKHGVIIEIFFII